MKLTAWLLCGAFLILASAARADYVDSSGIPNYIDERIANENWYCPIPTKDGERQLVWNTSTTYDLRIEGGNVSAAGEIGTLHMNGGQWALQSLAGRAARGFYQYLGTRNYINPSNGNRYLEKIMYVWGPDGPSTWTTFPRALADTSIPPPPQTPPALKIAPPDPKIVGTWVGYVDTPTGKYQSTLHIEPQGRYNWFFQQGAKTYTQTGVFEAAGGLWSIHPDKDPFDHGTYSVSWDYAGNKPLFIMASKQYGSQLYSIVWVNKTQ